MTGLPRGSRLRRASAAGGGGRQVLGPLPLGPFRAAPLSWQEEPCGTPQPLGAETRAGPGPPAGAGENAAPAGRAPGRLGPARAGGCGDWAGGRAGPPTARPGSAPASRQSRGLPLQSGRRDARSAGRRQPRPLPALRCALLQPACLRSSGKRRSREYKSEPSLAEGRGGGGGDPFCPSRAPPPSAPSPPQISEPEAAEGEWCKRPRW